MKRFFFLSSFLLVFFLSSGTVYAKIPNDPFATQWSYKMIHTEAAWDITTGSRSVVVAVIDDGFDAHHPDLAPNVWVNEHEVPNNGRDDDGNGYIDDRYGWDFVPKDKNGDGVIDEKEQLGDSDPTPEPGDTGVANNESTKIHHGTLVAGIIGAVGNNGIDGAGIAWNVRLMNVRFVDNDGFGTLAPLGKAIRYAVDNGADVINISLVGNENVAAIQEALAYAHARGVVVVAAAGNNQMYIDRAHGVFPVCGDAGSSQPTVLGVSAITEDRHIAPFSNYGSDCVDLAAPGVNISSTLRFSPTEGLAKEYGGGWNGTSFAAPHVSGVAALVKSLHPGWKADQIFDALLKTTSVTPSNDPTGYAHFFGAGLLQADAALRYVPSHEAGSPLDTSSFTVVRDGKEGPLGGSAESFSQIPGIVTPHDVVSYHEEQTSGFVATSFDTIQKKEVVSFFDSTWGPVRSWPTVLTRPTMVRVGNVTENEKSEVILLEDGGVKKAFVYTKFGQLIREIDAETGHTFLSFGISYGGGREKGTLLFLEQDESGQLFFSWYDDSFALVKQAPITFLGGHPTLVVGDVGEDGSENIVLASGPGSLPHVAFYDGNGAPISFFFGGNLGEMVGVSPSIVGGYIVAVSRGADHTIRLYDGTGKKEATIVSSAKALPFVL